MENIIRQLAILIPNVVLGYVLFRIFTKSESYESKYLVKDLEIMQKLPSGSPEKNVIKGYIDRQFEPAKIHNKKQFFFGFILYNVGFYTAFEPYVALNFKLLQPFLGFLGFCGFFLMYFSIFPGKIQKGTN
jgi:hypothetical protein